MILFGDILAYDLKTYLFLLACVLWWSEPLIFPSKMKGQDEGKNSFNLVFFGVLASIVGSFLFIYFDFVYPLFIPGLILMFAGIFLRFWSIRELGIFFTRGVKTSNNQELISSGAYKWFRHPMYIGLFLIACGASLFLGGLFSFLVAFLIMFYVLKQRISLEEEVLENSFGDKYLKWKKNRF